MALKNLTQRHEFYCFPSGKSVDDCKRQAKRIKKDLGCTHADALNIVARQNGYASWVNAKVALKRPSSGPTFLSYDDDLERINSYKPIWKNANNNDVEVYPHKGEGLFVTAEFDKVIDEQLNQLFTDGVPQHQGQVFYKLANAKEGFILSFMPNGTLYAFQKGILIPFPMIGFVIEDATLSLRAWRDENDLFFDKRQDGKSLRSQSDFLENTNHLDEFLSQYPKLEASVGSGWNW